ncbi:MAG: VOC family protein [Myxococcota bacterium]
MLSGINHITFAVHSLARSLTFYEQLGAKVEAQWNRGAFLRLGGVWVALLEGEVSNREATDYSHIAWNVAPANYAAMAERIESAGGRIWSENVTPGDSLFFMDPDGHRLELHAGTLDERLAALDADPPEGYRRR